MSDIIYSWTFSDEKNRWSLWYVIAFAIVIWLVVWWFLTKQYVLSFLIILITWVTLFVENNSSNTNTINITNLWIKINTLFYDYSKIISYSIIYDWENATILRININQKWFKYLDIDIDNKIALDIKEILPNFIKEDETWELSSIEKLIKILKL